MTKSTTPALRPYKIFFAAMAVLIIGAVALNTVTRQGPVHDARAEEDLRLIEEGINVYVSNRNVLPASLANLSGLPADTRQRLKDYEYTPSVLGAYELCANFQTVSPARQLGPAYYGKSDPSIHGKGRTCFRYDSRQGSSGPAVPAR
jgi:hypothetical protein